MKHFAQQVCWSRESNPPGLGQPPRRRCLGKALRLSWSKKATRGFFLRAADFFGFTKRLARERAELLPLAVVAYDDLDHVRITRDFLNAPARYLSQILQDKPPLLSGAGA